MKKEKGSVGGRSRFPRIELMKRRLSSETDFVMRFSFYFGVKPSDCLNESGLRL